MSEGGGVSVLLGAAAFAGILWWFNTPSSDGRPHPPDPPTRAVSCRELIAGLDGPDSPDDANLTEGMLREADERVAWARGFAEAARRVAPDPDRFGRAIGRYCRAHPLDTLEGAALRVPI